MMDGWFMADGGLRKTIAFLTPDQAELYGGYVDAAKALKVDFIRPPCFLDEHWQDLTDQIPAVGHA